MTIVINIHAIRYREIEDLVCYQIYHWQHIEQSNKKSQFNGNESNLFCMETQMRLRLYICSFVCFAFWWSVSCSHFCCIFWWLVEVPYWWNWVLFVTILGIFSCEMKNIIFAWREHVCCHGGAYMRWLMWWWWWRETCEVCLSGEMRMLTWGKKCPTQSKDVHTMWKCP